jgi:large subunit ribosomal protein L15
MDLSTVHHGVHKHKLKKRVGRGVGSGHGKTSSRGSKGQGSRAGARVPSQLFAGGQMPAIRRIPKRGFNNNSWKNFYAVVNLRELEAAFENGANIEPKDLQAKRLVRGLGPGGEGGKMDGVRILGTGELTKKLFIKAHGFSASAKEKIEAKGGKAILIPPPKKPVRNKMKPRPPKQPQA